MTKPLESASPIEWDVIQVSGAVDLLVTRRECRPDDPPMGGTWCVSKEWRHTPGEMDGGWECVFVHTLPAGRQVFEFRVRELVTQACAGTRYALVYLVCPITEVPGYSRLSI